MIIKLITLGVIAIAFAVASCGPLGIGGKKAPEEKPFGETGIPPQLRDKTPEGTPVIAGGNTGNGPLISSITPQEDIIYTDPDNPDAGIPELSSVLAAPKRGPWEQSETVAKQRSSREGKPLLIWFTDSTGSPMCKALSQELFATNDFGNWANEKLVRLKIDTDLKVTDPALSLGDAENRRADIRTYTIELRKRYKILGFPSMVMLSPSGEVVGRYRGYKRGEAQYLWGQMKHAEAVATKAYEGWRSGLEKKGYREWRDRRERRVFAKLISYKSGMLVLVEPDGTRAKTKEESLSDKDRAWIAEQKRSRNIQ